MPLRPSVTQLSSLSSLIWNYYLFLLKIMLTLIYRMGRATPLSFGPQGRDMS
jgi:hypothetical protein